MEFEWPGIGGGGVDAEYGRSWSSIQMKVRYGSSSSSPAFFKKDSSSVLLQNTTSIVVN